MEYLITLHDNQNSFNNEYYQLVTQYIKSKNNSDIKVIFNHDYPDYLSVIFDSNDNLTEIATGLEHYFKVKSNTYHIDKGDTDIWKGKQNNGKIGIIGVYRTKTNNILTYVNDSNHIFIMPLYSEEWKQNLHITSILHQRIYNERYNQPSVYVYEWSKYIYPLEEDNFTKEDFFDLVKINPEEHIFWDKLNFHIRGSELWFQYEDDNAIVSFSDLSIRHNDLWGDLYMFYPKKRPIKSTTYSKENLFYLDKYFDTKLLRSRMQIKRNLIELNYINLNNTYWLAVLGGILENMGEELIPKCFNVESIRKEYQEFQTFETLSKLREGR
ncbi:MAG TPA: hypothetical protein PLS98_08355 [Dictyoglomaceae bacterium]|nr:hypothetical protein [Dictyoglomaceae bacterium]